MSILETVYRCDACGKEEPWPAAAKKWARVEVHPVSWPTVRRDVTKHACSTPCEKQVLLALAGEAFTPEAVEAEAAEARPDLAARVEEERARHATEEAELRAEAARQARTIRALEEERSRLLAEATRRSTLPGTSTPAADMAAGETVRERAERARALTEAVELLGLQVKRAAVALEGVLREEPPRDGEPR
jgi:hypothetical protein